MVAANVDTLVDAVVEAYFRRPNAEAIGDRSGRFMRDRAFAAMVAANAGTVIDAVIDPSPVGIPPFNEEVPDDIRLLPGRAWRGRHP